MRPSLLGELRVEIDLQLRDGALLLDTLGVEVNTIIQLSDADRAVHDRESPIWLRTLGDDAQHKLRQAGITVGAASAALDVKVTVFYEEDISNYVYDVHLSLKQTVTTNRGERVSAATWEAGVAGIAGTNEMPEAVKGRINHLVDVFLKAYHAENISRRHKQDDS